MASSMKELFEIIDRMDAPGFANAFTEGGRFRFGNNPTVSARDGIREAVDQFFSNLKGLRHEILDVWEADDVVISEVEVTYTRKDGQELLLPAATIGRRSNGLLEDYRIYMDVNPLFA